MKSLMLVASLTYCGVAHAQMAPEVLAQFKLHACKRAGMDRLEGAGFRAEITKATKDKMSVRTPDEWGCLIIGSLDRSNAIKMLGKPSQAMAGMLFFKDKARDPDTGDLLTLQVVFSNGEDQVATHVMYFQDPGGQPSPAR